MKKGICLLLSICMLLGCGITNVFAAKDNASTEGNILFSDDFESYSDGQPLATNNKDANAWTKQSNAATTKIAGYKDETGMVMRFTNTNTEGTNGPRFEKHFDFSALTNLTLTYRAKSEGCKFASVAYMGGTGTTLVNADTKGEWNSYKIVMDFKAGTFDVYVNGELSSEGKAFKALDTTEVQIRFTSTIGAGEEAFVDDIVFSTTDNVTAEDILGGGEKEEKIVTPEEIMAVFDKTPAPALSVPAGKYTLFTYDCSLNGDSYVPTGSEANFSKISTSDYIKPVLLDKEKVIRATNLERVQKTPRFEKNLTLGEKPTTLTVEFYAQFTKGSQSSMTIYLQDAAGTNFAAAKNGFVPSGTQVWDHIKAVFDFNKKSVVAYLNGKEVDSVSFSKEVESYSEVQMRIFPVLQPGDTILLDNFIIYSDAAPDFGDAKYYGSTGTNWAKIGEPVTEKSYVSNLNAHPRLFINSRTEVTDKIATDEQCAIWYAETKDNADLLLTAPCETYTFANGRNILNAARSIERRMMMLGFTYLVEQDRKYVERGLKEIRNAGTFPDWSNVAPMIPSELMYGVACFYDWCYDALTPEERTEIIDILKKQALWQFVRSYDGVISVEIAKGTSNRTMIANTSAAGIALAIADEEPQLAEYLLTYALKHGRQPVEAFGADGGFPEGASYWGLATEYMVYMLAQLESAFKPEFEKPEAITWFFDNPVVENMGDYWVYTAGPKKNFNFGDASDTIEGDPTPYWLAARYNKPLYNWALDKRSGVNYPYFALLYKDVNMSSDVGDTPLDKTFDAKDDAQVATFRSSWTDDNAIYAAMQGGYNGTGHMFKSLGTFVIDANGQRFIRTLGRSDYSSLYDANMYYQKRAEGQNTLIVNPGKGWDQVETAYAKFIRHEEAENEAFSILDMTQTSYDFASAKRGMYITKGRNSIVLQDEVTMKKPSELWWFAHATGDITLSADKKSALLTVGNERMYVAITEGPADATFEIMAARPLPTSPTAPDEVYQDIYKLAIHMTNVTEMTLAVEFVPLKEGEAAPETLTPVTKMDTWSVSDNAISTARQAGNTVALFLNSPVVLDKGYRTYVDTANMDVYPFTDNGRTLVPVRFISESFDAQVGWYEATQTVSVTKGNTTIQLQIGSDKMLVNGEERILDVPAQTYNSRTLIPLRALVEALGKKVLWDDRGLIVISDSAVEYTEAEKVNIISLLSERVLLNGAEMKSFTTDKTDYTMLTDGNIPTVTLASGAPVVQNGNTASFTIGEKSYTITFVTDKFAGQDGTNSPNNITELKLSASLSGAPEVLSRQSVAHVTFSAGHDKYVEFGTVDNIISDALVNRWSAAKPAWICYEFAEPVSLYAFGLAGLGTASGPRSFIFNAEVSVDGINWEQVLDTRTSGTTNMPEIFELGGKTAKYFRINGQGDANGGSYNSYTEVCFYTSKEQMETDMQYWPIYFAGNSVNGSVGETKALVLKAYNGKGEEVLADGVVFTSSNPAVATVDANGVVTFVGKGDTTIAATYEGKYAKVEAAIDITVM